jgi:hypothetical protein
MDVTTLNSSWSQGVAACPRFSAMKNSGNDDRDGADFVWAMFSPPYGLIEFLSVDRSTSRRVHRRVGWSGLGSGCFKTMMPAR